MMADELVQRRLLRWSAGVLVLVVDAQRELPTRPADEWAQRTESYLHDKLGDRYVGRFRKDEKSPVLTFDKAVVVKIYCEIHKHMRNLLLVLDTPWFTTSDAQGRFVLSDIPAGEYSLKAFLPSEKVLHTRVSIHDGRKASINLAP